MYRTDIAEKHEKNVVPDPESGLWSVDLSFFKVIFENTLRNPESGVRISDCIIIHYSFSVVAGLVLAYGLFYYCKMNHAIDNLNVNSGHMKNRNYIIIKAVQVDLKYRPGLDSALALAL